MKLTKNYFRKTEREFLMKLSNKMERAKLVSLDKGYHLQDEDSNP